MFEKEPAAMSPQVEEMARLVIAEGGSTCHVDNIIQFHLKGKSIYLIHGDLLMIKFKMVMWLS